MAYFYEQLYNDSSIGNEVNRTDNNAFFDRLDCTTMGDFVISVNSIADLCRVQKLEKSPGPDGISMEVICFA